MKVAQRLLVAVGMTLFSVAHTPFAAAQSEYPTRPVRLIVPFAPGGGQDMIGRLLGGKLAEAFGKQVVVDNRPGGGSVVASEIVAAAAADGHTLYLIEGNFTVVPSLSEKLSFDPVRSFAPVARVSVSPGAVIVHASVPATTFGELLALARAQPGKLNFGSSGIGGASHLSGELLKLMTGIDIVHVAYKGSARVTSAMLGGEVAMAIINPVSTLPHVKAGKLKLLAVTTAKRVPSLPDVPTVAESGVPGFENAIWNGIVVRAGTPAAVVDRINREVVKASLSSDMKDQLARNGASVFGPDTPQDFARFIQSEIEKWAKVVKAAGIRSH